jgi:hypothetical protein
MLLDGPTTSYLKKVCASERGVAMRTCESGRTGRARQTAQRTARHTLFASCAGQKICWRCSTALYRTVHRTQTKSGRTPMSR